MKIFSLLKNHTIKNIKIALNKSFLWVLSRKKLIGKLQCKLICLIKKVSTSLFIFKLFLDFSINKITSKSTLRINVKPTSRCFKRKKKLNKSSSLRRVASRLLLSRVGAFIVFFLLMEVN